MRSRKGEIGISVVGRLPGHFAVTRRQLAEAAAFFAWRSRSRTAFAWHEVVVHLVRDLESDAVHRAVMGMSGATDVITQAYDAIPPESPGIFGELFVNTDMALRAAPRRRGWSATHELLLYIAQGMDHLSGADDHSPEDYLAMRRRELSWLRSLRSKLPIPSGQPVTGE